MKHLYFSTDVQGDYQTVFKRFDKKLFEALKPPGVELKVTRFDGSNKGDQVHLKLRIAKLMTLDWVSLISENVSDEKQCYFIDDGVKVPFPLKAWRHRHVVKKTLNDRCLIIDAINYSCHGGLVIENLLWPILWWQFSCRAPIYRRFFGNEK